MSKLVHKTTAVIRLQVKDGIYEERHALSSDKLDDGIVALACLLKSINERRDCVIVGFSWGLRDPAEVDQFSLKEVSP